MLDGRYAGCEDTAGELVIDTTNTQNFDELVRAILQHADSTLPEVIPGLVKLAPGLFVPLPRRSAITSHKGYYVNSPIFENEAKG